MYQAISSVLTDSRYYNSEKHSDITILLQDGTIKAHKLVLSEGSDYCKACFEGGFKVC